MTDSKNIKSDSHVAKVNLILDHGFNNPFLGGLNVACWRAVGLYRCVGRAC